MLNQHAKVSKINTKVKREIKMVEASGPTISAIPEGDLNDLTDDQFEAMCANLPKMTTEEQEQEMEEWVNHPLNCKEVTPEMLELPEY